MTGCMQVATTLRKLSNLEFTSSQLARLYQGKTTLSAFAWEAVMDKNASLI